MLFELSEKEMIDQYSDYYQTLVSNLKSKKGYKHEIPFKFYFEYCVRIDNDEDNSTNVDDYVNFRLSKIGGGLKIKQNRLYNTLPLERDNYPISFVNSYKDSYNFLNKEKEKQKRKEINLQNVLNKLKISGTTKPDEIIPFDGNIVNFMFDSITNSIKKTNHRMPTFFELSEVYPNIVEEYKERANGDVLVMYDPEHKDSDEYGFIFLNVRAISIRNNNIRCHTVEENDFGITYALYPDECKTKWLGYIDHKYVMKAKLGEEFRGWKKTKQYRPTLEEQYKYLKGKIYYINTVF